MKRLSLLLLITVFLPLVAVAGGRDSKAEAAAMALAQRVCMNRDVARSLKFVGVRKENPDETDVFCLSAEKDKVLIEGNSVTALTAGLNWYLNHHAGVNLSWNNLAQRVDSFPLPQRREEHRCSAQYRYYLNYCTFSYSMSFWEWERWQQELDWMALHGINLPLMAVGLDAVWHRVCTRGLGMSEEQTANFVAGPAFQGWWLMNNLQGHGGPNRLWWYERQERLARQIVKRMHELGMEPVVPGFIGMVPQEYAVSSQAGYYSGSWAGGFTCPAVLKPGEDFDRIARLYYDAMRRVYGSVRYFSMDPMHERNYPAGMGDREYAELVAASQARMDEARMKWTRAKESDAVWVAQMWQQNADRGRLDCLNAERSLLLDLASERTTYVGNFGTKPYLFCMLHNYGGNIGLYGCAQQMLDNYYNVHRGKANLRGVGATMEGIETNPVMYELLYELPWRADTVRADRFFARYPQRRYGQRSMKASHAWSVLQGSVYSDNQTWQQGCREPVFCARPNLRGDGASAWAYADFDWSSYTTATAARLLLNAGLQGENYKYDVVDVVRQALSDYGHDLQMRMAATAARHGFESAAFKAQADSFMVLMADIDRLLGTMPQFRLGRWTEAARRVAVEAGHPEDADWMEMNARMLITTWSKDDSNLHDYANRQYQGMMADYYAPRWNRYFQLLVQRGEGQIEYSRELEQPFVNGVSVPYGHYSAEPVGDALAVARELMDKYLPDYKPAPNGELWPDADGNHINAHGGMVMRVGDLWYWWGEDRPDRGFTTREGVAVYTSPDLKHWTYGGTALSVSHEPGSDIEQGCIMERPKVLHCPTTGKWVMLFHLELKGRGYEAARVGFAVSDRPEGPYSFVRSLRPNPGIWPVEMDSAAIAVAQGLRESDFEKSWTPEWLKAVRDGMILSRDVPGGQMSRDMTVYVDDDGRAYHIFSAEENLTLNLAELTPDYLGYTGRYTRIAAGGQNEAPTLLKHGDTYWLIASGCTGWAPNRARMFSAPSLWGPWKQHDTPFRGPGADRTFGGQGTYIFDNGRGPVFMADVWNPQHLRQSRHLWLPITFDANGTPVIEWEE